MEYSDLQATGAFLKQQIYLKSQGKWRTLSKTLLAPCGRLILLEDFSRCSTSSPSGLQAARSINPTGAAASIANVRDCECIGRDATSRLCVPAAALVFCGTPMELCPAASNSMWIRSAPNPPRPYLSYSATQPCTAVQGGTQVRIAREPTGMCESYRWCLTFSFAGSDVSQPD